jgi:hypothetical protein
VNGVLQLVLVATTPRSHTLPCGVSYSIAARRFEGWPLVFADDPGLGEDLYNGLEFHPSWTWDSRDVVSRVGGDAQVQ